MKKFLCLLICILMTLSLFTGCGASSKSQEMDSAGMMDNEMQYSSSDMAVEESAPQEPGWTTSGNRGEPEEAPNASEGDSDAAQTEKIIYTANLGVETREFDQSVAAIEAMVEEFGGYIQDSSINGDSWYNEDGTTSVINRYAWYTVAVPVESFEKFLQKTGEVGNVTSESRSAENITSQYTDTEARIKSLEVQEERLLAMMEEATDIESLVTLEARLSEVTYEIESYERQLQNWDRRVAYSTVTLELWEVASYTQTAPVNRSFGEKLTDALSDGWHGFVRSAEGFVLWGAEALPMLIVLAVIVAVVLLVTGKLRKHRKAKKTAPPEPAEPPKDEPKQGTDN